MTNIYALKFQLDGSDEEIILNALNQGDAIRKAETWFARKFRRNVPQFSAKPVASMVICGSEKEIVCQPFPQPAHATAASSRFL
ncbi:MAG TPA: hypothetical protein VKF79_07970 [Candidatus Acidoferrum sp.]|nr:hypothetical protein [Candidatus Acidoferrum sp.]